MSGANKLSGMKVKTAEAGKYGDGAGLWLRKRDKARGKWSLHYTIHGNRREMGLGPYPDISLEKAREIAAQWRPYAKQGIDPIKERERQRREAERNLHILSDIAKDTFEARKAELRGDGKAGRWFSPLELHILPKLGNKPVAEIDQIDIRDTLAPIWQDKAETARKAISRLGICLKHAAALGLDVDLQAVDKAKALLGAQRAKSKHIPYIPWPEIPAFYASLSDGSITHLALRLLILTGLRSKPIRFLHLDQIEGDIWTVPGDNMKSSQAQIEDFRVPLSSEALSVIDQARAFARDGFLFPSVRKGVISDATMSRHMERRGLEARPHGFRASFRTWAEECANERFEVAESALAHKVGNKTQRAYLRDDRLERRRVLMERWACFVTGRAAGGIYRLDDARK